MSNLPSKFCGFPVYVQMNPDLSFSCFCPSETGSPACKLHPHKEFRTLELITMVSHLEKHVSGGDEQNGILQSVIEDLAVFLPEWRRRVKQRGGVG